MKVTAIDAMERVLNLHDEMADAPDIHLPLTNSVWGTLDFTRISMSRKPLPANGIILCDVGVSYGSLDPECPSKV